MSEKFNGEMLTNLASVFGIQSGVVQEMMETGADLEVMVEGLVDIHEGVSAEKVIQNMGEETTVEQMAELRNEAGAEMDEEKVLEEEMKTDMMFGDAPIEKNSGIKQSIVNRLQAFVLRKQKREDTELSDADRLSAYNRILDDLNEEQQTEVLNMVGADIPVDVIRVIAAEGKRTPEIMRYMAALYIKQRTDAGMKNGKVAQEKEKSHDETSENDGKDGKQ